MAKTVLMFAIAALVLFSIGVWLATAGPTGNAGEEVLMVVIVLLLVGFALFKGIQRVRSLERKKTMTKSYSLLLHLPLSLAFHHVHQRSVNPGDAHIDRGRDRLYGAHISGKLALGQNGWAEK
jgi:FtsH-binding integral membrane protein